MPAARSPFNEYEVGPRYWRKLHDLADLRQRSPRAQTLVLLLWALERACAGEDVELSQEQLERTHVDDQLQVA